MAMAVDLSATKAACLGSTKVAAGARRTSSGPCTVVIPCRRDFRRAMVCYSASGDSKDPISVAIESHVGSEPLVMDVAAGGEQQGDVHPSRESITNVASESAVESPDQVHHQAESEAAPLARESGHPVEEITGKIEAEAEQAASDLKEPKGGVLEPLKSGSESALQGLEMAKEAVQKGAKVLANEAGQKGSQFVDVAKKGIQELKQKLGNSNDEERSSSEMLKHSAADVEDVNKDGEATLKKQRNQDEAIEQVMKEFVEPARRRKNGDGSPELGDGNERFKDPGDSLASHDPYSPIHDI